MHKAGDVYFNIQQPHREKSFREEEEMQFSSADENDVF